MDERYKEHSERGTVIDQLGHCINSYREAAVSTDAKFDHIDISEKQKVIMGSLLGLKSQYLLFGCSSD